MSSIVTRIRSPTAAAWRWFRHGWPAGANPSAAERNAFDETLRADTARDLPIAVGVMMALNLMYWPTDAWAFPGRPDVVAAVSTARLVETLLGVAALVAV